MSLLRFSPEVRRLRRVAKACAAGEVSRREYRLARREVIDHFMETFQQYGDETIPRADLDVTLRRQEVFVDDSPQPVSMRRWTPCLIVFLCVLVLSQWAFGSEIAAVRDRDPNPNTSPRLTVTELVWDVPLELAISPVQVGTFLADRLQRVREANAPLDHGFSTEELQQVARFLDAIGIHEENTRMTTQDLLDLSALVANQKQQRGVSVAQLEEIARGLQQYVRAQGYPLARAYVPQQHVVNGRVALDVQVGRLSSVEVAGSSSNVRSRFDGLLGQPIEGDRLETKLNGLNRLPGVHAQASFVAGDAVGESAMLLNVTQEQRLRGVAQFDNYGLEHLGEERVTLLGQVNNPRGVGDQLEVSLSGSLRPADHKQGALSYLTPLLSGRFDGRVRLASADLDWQESLGVAGRGLLFDVELRDTRVFTRTSRREFQFLAGVHDLQWEGLLDQRSWFVGAGLTGHRLWDRRKFSVEGQVQTIFGGLDATRPGQDTRFWLTTLQGRAWMPWDVPWLNVRAKAVIDFRGQISRDLLPTTQRLGLTGVTANRGFAQAGLMVDEGFLLKTEVLFAAPLGEWGVFVDAGYGDRNNANNDWYQLTSMGISWRARLFGRDSNYVLSNLSLGKPVSHRGSDWAGGLDGTLGSLGRIGAVDDSARIFWSLQYAH